MVSVNSPKRVLVYGATGHTGVFVVKELVRRRLAPVLAGRNAERLSSLPDLQGLERRVSGVEDPDLLQQTVADVDVVVNCAGPFLDTAAPLARAAVRTGAHYLDVTAEQPVVRELYRELDAPARAAGVAVVPALAFYGGLPDLLVTAALDGSRQVDEVDIAVGLDRWWPTGGTRATGTRNTAVRQVIRGGVLAPLEDPAPTRVWSYPDPFGTQRVVQLPLSEVITLNRHLELDHLRSYLNTAALDDLHDEATPPPSPDDERGRSSQRFVVDVVVRRGSVTRRITSAGRDIYAVTAPIVVEGAVRLLSGRFRDPGASAPGEAFDADDFLTALEKDGNLTVERDGSSSLPAGARKDAG
jgi:short subunit dehydrogenase-like uncharacterized protein